MRRSFTLSLFALVLVALLPQAVLFSPPAHAAPRASSGIGNHITPFPTYTRWKQQRGAVPAGTPGGTGDLIWHGGPVQEQPVVYVVFWGTAWNNGSGGLTADGQIVKNYFNDVAGTAFENILTQYYDTNQTHIFKGLTVGGIWLDTSAPPSDTSCGGPTIEDQSIQSEVNNASQSNGWPAAGTDITYFVYTPNGFLVNGGGACSEQAFCAYHSFTSTLNGVAYAAMPYPLNLQACGAIPSSPNGNAFGDSLVNVTSHEQFEAITDPTTLNGWYDSANPAFEIGDKCAWDFSSGLTHLNNGGTFALQTEYSNASHSCINSYAPAASHVQVSPASLNLVSSGANLGSQTLTLSNSGSGTLNWSANTLPPWVTLNPTSGALTAGHSQALILTFHLSNAIARQNFATTLTITDPNASNTLASVPIQVNAANVSKVWYFAEGFTGPGFSEFLTLANPNTSPTPVTVQYLLGSGNPITQNYTVSANARSTILVNNVVGPNQNVSMVVTSTLPIIAERPMYFTFAGTIPGGSDVLGSTQLGTSFDFGYLDTTSGYNTFLTILNQNNTPITATINYFPANGGGTITQVHSISQTSRGTVSVNGDVPPGRYSALVTLSAQGLVERPLYFTDVFGNPGSADVVGVSTLQTQWYFAEGFLSNSFSEFYFLSNPTGTSDAHVTVTYLLSNGAPFVTSVTIPPGRLQILDSSIGLGNNNVSNSAVIQSDVPILAERFMTFQYMGAVGTGGPNARIPGATDVLGAAAPTNLFYFAEGYTGGKFAEYLTLENPNNSPATVQVSYLPDTGAPPTVRTYVLAANSRSTVFTNSVMPNKSFSMVVSSNLPILAERPMYFIFNGTQTGGSDVVGYQGDPPPVAGSSVYVSATDANVYALDAGDGSVRWHHQLGSNGGTPTVANGAVFVISGDDVVSALRSSDGSLLWSFPMLPGSGLVQAAPAVADGVVYALSFSQALYALDANTGAVLWQLQGAGYPSSMSPVVANGVLYIGSLDGQFFAFRASDGRLLWMNFSNNLDKDSTPVVVNGVVYFAANPGTGLGHIYALDAATGKRLWSTNQALGAPAVSNGLVFSSSPQGAKQLLFAFNASTGSAAWSTPSPNGASFGPPAADNGLVYVEENAFFAFSTSTGSQAWSYPAGGDRLTPTLANGVVYFSAFAAGSLTTILYAVQANTGTLVWKVAVGSGIAAPVTIAPPT